MYNYQDILKKHTALTLGRKSVDTSVIMFPVRMETRFVDDYPVEDIDEPDRALYAFQAFWSYVDALEKPDAELLEKLAWTVMYRVEELDVVYREDKARLRELARKIVEATAPEGVLKSTWDRIQVHLGRLATLDVVSDNVATDFLRRFRRAQRAMLYLHTLPRYKGKKRAKEFTQYSQTAIVNKARKRLGEILTVLELLLPENPEDSIVNKFTMISSRQYEKFQKALRIFDNTPSVVMSVYGEPSNTKDPHAKLPLKQQILDGLHRDLEAFKTYQKRYNGSKFEGIAPRKQSLCDKVRSRIGDYHHYTEFAEKMILWRLRMATGKKTDIANYARVEKWRYLADNTIFSFHEERQWLISILETYNAYKAKNDDCRMISASRLNRHNKFIRPRKLCYLKKKKCLLVRIYPDEVAVTQMARPYTKDELENALNFWLRYFYEAGNELKQKAAWESFCSLYTPPRAALIARHLFASNCWLTVQEIANAAKTCRSQRKSFESWSAEMKKKYTPRLRKAEAGNEGEDLFPVPMSELMPDRFILQATLDNRDKKGVTLVRYGHLIPKTIQVGLDLNKEAEVNHSDRGIELGGNLRWMTDYKEAEKMGMAITLPLDAFPWDHHSKNAKQKAKDAGRSLANDKLPRTFTFKSIYVMGVKTFSPDNMDDSRACSSLLLKVFNAHLYSTEGLELLKIGTPTNILTDEDETANKSGGQLKNSDYDTDYTALVDEFFRKSIVTYGNGVKGGNENCDANILTSLFGFVANAAENPFLNTLGRDNREVLKSRTVNKAFLDVLSQSQPILKLLFNNERLHDYFCEDVVATGVFPPFRIGNQPYGILPVCDFKNLKYNQKDPLYTLKNLLLLLTEKWNYIVEQSVLSEENINKQSVLSTEESYLKAVSSTPLSTSFYTRSTIREPDLLPADYFKEKMNDVKSFEEIYNNVKGLTYLSQRKLFEKYFPKLYDLPVRDPGYTRFMYDFTWRDLETAIKKKVKDEACMEGVTDEELRTLITGTFDLFNYRLDAWLTGLLHQRYGVHVKRGRHKISIGAYGWVFNLTEDKQEPASDEYIVAPSVNQAITAAVLRSSFNRAANGKSQDYSLSVNLSSSRVRQALRIIQGIRNGLSLGTILGSDLERMMHEDWKLKGKGGYEMDYFIFFLRHAYPLNRTDTQYGANDSVKRNASLDVLNGVALLEDLRGSNVNNQQKLQLTDLYNWNKNSTLMKGWLQKLLGESDEKGLNKWITKIADFKAETNRLIVLIQRMEDAYDALADVITSESVYKLTEGNRVAVEALMNSMNTGRNFPEPDVVEIPLNSAHIEQRVFAALNPDEKPDAKDASILRKAEPSLDGWMGRMLGFDDIMVQFMVDGAAANFPLGEKGAGISPSELVYLSYDWDKFQQFLYLLCWQRGAAPGAKSILLDQAAMAVDSLRELIAHARPLKQDDLAVSSVPTDESLYRSDICVERYKDVRASISRLAGEMVKEADCLKDFFETTPLTPLSETQFKYDLGLLLQCFRLGISDALSGIDLSILVDEKLRYDHPAEFSEILARQQGLADKLTTLANLLADRLAKADEVLADVKPGTEWEVYPDALKKMLVSSFIMVPHFRLEGNETIDMSQLEAQSQDARYFKNAGRIVLEDNMVGLSDVRTQLQCLHQVRMYGKMNFLDAAREILPMQLEAEPGQDKYWMGAEVKNESSVRDANVYTVLNPSEFIAKQPSGWRDAAGLMIDYWVERIPYRDQTAAVTFGYDQPDAEPPQAILVGMSTLAGRRHWSEERLLRTIHCAMYQVKSRAVEPEHVYADKWTSSVFPLLTIDPDKIK